MTAAWGIDLADLARQRGVIVEDFEQYASAFVKKLFLLLFAWLVKPTPVKTGRARNGWDAATGAPSAYVPAEGLDSYPEPQPPLSEAERFRVGMILWIVNNVNYIGVLDKGSSDQAPAGMTPVALANLDAQFG